MFFISLLQVYQVKTGNYICRNKYHGRRLGVDGFKDTLLQFLHNGRNLRIDVISPVIERLRQLHAVLEKQESFRFYTSSLLIIYDGGRYSSQSSDNHRPKASSDDDSSQDSSQASNFSMDKTLSNCSLDNDNLSDKCTTDFDVRMIDFAHSTRKGFDSDVVHHGPDRGYMFGLENLISFMEAILKEFG